MSISCNGHLDFVTFRIEHLWDIMVNTLISLANPPQTLEGHNTPKELIPPTGIDAMKSERV